MFPVALFFLSLHLVSAGENTCESGEDCTMTAIHEKAKMIIAEAKAEAAAITESARILAEARAEAAKIKAAANAEASTLLNQHDQQKQPAEVEECAGVTTPPGSSSRTSIECKIWEAVPDSGATNDWCRAVISKGVTWNVHPNPSHCRCADLFAPNTETRAVEKQAPKTKAARAVIKGPIHAPCQRKDHPGLVAFAEHTQKKYAGKVEVVGYMQPPHILFYDSEDDYMGEYKMMEDASAADYALVLLRHGLDSTP